MNFKYQWFFLGIFILILPIDAFSDESYDDEYEDELQTIESLDEKQAQATSDPFKPVNHAVFQFNDSLYFKVVKPVAKTYNKIVPKRVRIGLFNFFRNIKMPVRFLNCVFQIKFIGASSELTQFTINSTIGCLGFGKPAQTVFHLKPREEDLGQTLGVYGIGNGIYIVWPIIGPTTLRDTIGSFGDTIFNPLSYITPWYINGCVKGVDSLNSASLRIGEYESLKQAAFEPYDAMKDAYIQYRHKKVAE